MKTPRNVKRSYYDSLEALFKDASTFGTAFNVYYESDLYDTVPVRPYIFILDANIVLEMRWLPAVSTLFRFSYRDFQLGGPKWWHGEVYSEVYGANRGERDDIAAAIAEGVPNGFTIYDYSGGSEVAWGTASIYENPSGEYWSLDPGSAGDEAAVEGTLLNWTTASTRFWCKPT